MKSDQPLVSIITPSFNQVEYLETTIQSVLEQDYPHIEYIIIDGGSTDGSLDIIQRYAPRLSYWTSEPDHGQAEAINKGMRRASGDLIAWLNSDDVYLPGALANAVETALQRPDAGMVYGDGIMVGSNLELLDPHRYRTLSALDLLSFEILLQPAAFIRRAALEEVGHLNEDYHLILDHELWVRIAGRYPLHHVHQFWALERTHEAAKTIHQADKFVEEARRLIEWATHSQEFEPLVRQNRRRIMAGLSVFSARRLIDAGQHPQAVAYLARAMALHPPTVARYWYKVVQAVGSALGFEWLFLRYRATRRRIRFKNEKVELPYAAASYVVDEDQRASKVAEESRQS